MPVIHLDRRVNPPRPPEGAAEGRRQRGACAAHCRLASGAVLVKSLHLRNGIPRAWELPTQPGCLAGCLRPCHVEIGPKYGTNPQFGELEIPIRNKTTPSARASARDLSVGALQLASNRRFGNNSEELCDLTRVYYHVW